VAELVGADPIRLALDATCPDCREQHGQIVVPDYPIHVSLSHSRLAVIAVASARPIGVDVESTVQSIERLAAIGIVAGQPSIAGWTAVEAVLKADGRGLRVDPKRVEFEGFGEKLEARVTDRATRYSITEPFIRDGIHASIAVAI
jgi:4'-phosphopantetheinyl transferase